jgi:deoxyhypusine monooxygenase
LLRFFSADTSVAELGQMLIDEKRPMFERYGAMFALRDIGTEEAVEVCVKHKAAELTRSIDS